MFRVRRISRVAVVAICLALLTACGGSSPEELIRADVTARLDAISADRGEVASALEQEAPEDLERFGVDAERFTKAWLDGFSYRVDKIEVDEDGETATVQVTLQAKKLSEILESFRSKLDDELAEADASSVATEADLNKLSGEALLASAGAAEPKQAACALSYAKAPDGSWAADEDAAQELLDAIG